MQKYVRRFRYESVFPESRDAFRQILESWKFDARWHAEMRVRYGSCLTVRTHLHSSLLLLSVLTSLRPCRPAIRCSVDVDNNPQLASLTFKAHLPPLSIRTPFPMDIDNSPRLNSHFTFVSPCPLAHPQHAAFCPCFSLPRSYRHPRRTSLYSSPSALCRYSASPSDLEACRNYPHRLLSFVFDLILSGWSVAKVMQNGEQGTGTRVQQGAC